jgi:hypothetical protein
MRFGFSRTPCLTDGTIYLFTSRDVRGLGQGIYVGSLDSTDVRRQATRLPKIRISYGPRRVPADNAISVFDEPIIATDACHGPDSTVRRLTWRRLREARHSLSLAVERLEHRL